MNKYGYIILIAFLITSCDNNNNKKKKKPSLNSEQSSNTKNQMEELMKILITDSEKHQGIGSRLTDSEIKDVEKELGLSLPYSYKLFLKQFGNGAYWLYTTPIDDIKYFSYLRQYHKELGNTIELIGEKEIEVNSLLSLMTEDSNGGAWVWLTSENSDSQEWSLAYYSLSNKKLYYKVGNFTE